MARAAVSDPWRKSLPRMLIEMARTGVRAGRFPSNYFKYRLYRTDAGDPDNYLTKREGRRIKSAVRDRSRRRLVGNKLLFHHHFRDADVELPALLGYNAGSVFFSGGTRQRLDTPDDFRQLLESLLSRSNSGGVFVKPVCGQKGKTAFKLDSASLRPERIERHHADVCSGNFIFEGAIVQHPLLSKIHPSSVNTVRFMTCVRSSGAVEIVSAALRMGVNGSSTDNWSTGGLVVKVDLESGALGPHARRRREFGGTVHPTHPDTDFELSGCVLPHFDAAAQTARVAAEHFPYPLVGWDVVITSDGPMLIEGNSAPHLYCFGSADGGYRKNPVFRAFLDDLGIS